MSQNSQMSLKEKLPIEVTSLQEAKKRILEMTKNRMNNRDILKTKFRLDGRILRFNPSQIKRIKDESESKNLSKKVQTKDAILFKLFKKGMTRTDIVIRTGDSPDDVDAAYQKFIGFEKRVDISKSFNDAIFLLARRVSNTDSYDGVLRHLTKAVDDALKYRSFTYPCRRCHKPITILGPEWRDIRVFLFRKGWGHEICP